MKFLPYLVMLVLCILTSGIVAHLALGDRYMKVWNYIQNKENSLQAASAHCDELIKTMDWHGKNQVEIFEKARDMIEEKERVLLERIARQDRQIRILSHRLEEVEAVAEKTVTHR